MLFLTRATPSLKPAQRHGPGTLKTAVIAPASRFYVILDASGSMLDNIDGRMKFDIARGAVRSMIDALPPSSDVAMRVYGHRKSALQPDADLDTELKIRMGPLNRQAFNAALDSLRSRGKTPMALSIEDALKDLGNTATEASPVTLLLLTDGGEDTRRPKGDPILAAAKIAKVPNLSFHIVGFDINEPVWSQQLQEMARVSGGKYWPAARAADLERSVRNAVLGIPERFVIADADGRELTHGAFGDSLALNEGKYHFRTVFAGHTFDQPFYISPGEATSVTFDASQVKPGDMAAGASDAAPAAPAAPSPAAPTANWPKFCTRCGAPLKPGEKFCHNCGTKVEMK
jgi:von Willebrand factor type A domain-containing protein/zinc ribbon protein